MKHRICMLTVRALSILLLVATLASLTPLPLHAENVTGAHTGTEPPVPGQRGDPAAREMPLLTGTSYSNPNFVRLDAKPVAGPGKYEDLLQGGSSSNWVHVTRSRLTATTYDSSEFPAGSTLYLLARPVAADHTVNPRWDPAQATVPGTPTPTPAPPISALPAPTLTALSTGATTVDLNWTQVNGAVSYELLVWWNGATDWQRAHDGNLQGTSFTHNERTPGTTYFYIVAALDSGGVRGAWSAQLEVTVRESDPPTPTPTPTPTATPTASALPAPTLKAEPGKGQITLTWGAVANAESYELIVWNRALDDWRGIGGVLTSTSYTHSVLTIGTENYYLVRAVAGNGSTSAWSESVNATVSETQTPTVTSTPTPTPTSPITQAAATAERAALVALFEAAGGVNWKRSDNWLTNEPISAWFGVHTDETGHVSDLALDNNRLRGSVPDLGALTKLRSLRLAYNQLTGPIPDLSKLTKLNLLQLHSNRLNGSIPDLSALANLTYLYLVGNELSGEIPDLDALVNLVVLDLGSNQLSGPIPNVGVLTKLRFLSLHGNRLTGPIPDLPALTFLTALNLGSNQLTGPIPDLNSFAYLTGLYLNDNDLTGQIRDLSLFTSLKRLSLNGNQLTGKIPELRALSSLEDLDLSHNRLSGEIPELNALTELRWLDLSHNRLTGEIPELDALTLLKGLVLNDNKLSGNTPDLGTLANLAWLDLSDNTLTGPVLDLNILINLEGLLLSNNRLTGPVPDLSALANLAWLDLRDNVLCLPVLSVLSSSNRVVSSHLNRLNLAACADA